MDADAEAAVETDWAWFERFVKEHGDPGKQRLDFWRRRRSSVEGWPKFEAEFRAMRHKALFRLAVDEVMSVVHGTRHSLGNLKKECATIGGIHNFSPPVPMMYGLHLLLEQKGAVPDWDEALDFWFHQRPELFWKPLGKIHGMEGLTYDQALCRWETDAVLWRLGTTYYSWLREIHFLAVMREKYGLDLRYHFLADSEFKADFVADKLLIELYIKNDFYKDGPGKGRKETCKKLNPPPFKVIDIPMESEMVAGKVWLVKPDFMRQTACKLEELGCPRIR